MIRIQVNVLENEPVRDLVLNPVQTLLYVHCFYISQSRMCHSRGPKYACRDSGEPMMQNNFDDLYSDWSRWQVLHPFSIRKDRSNPPKPSLQDRLEYVNPMSGCTMSSPTPCVQLCQQFSNPKPPHCDFKTYVELVCGCSNASLGIFSPGCFFLPVKQRANKI